MLRDLVCFAPLLLPVPLNSSTVGVIVNNPFSKSPARSCQFAPAAVASPMVWLALYFSKRWCALLPGVLGLSPWYLIVVFGFFKAIFLLSWQRHFALTRKSQKKSSHKASLEPWYKYVNKYFYTLAQNCHCEFCCGMHLICKKHFHYTWQEWASEETRNCFKKLPSPKPVKKLNKSEADPSPFQLQLSGNATCRFLV